ncbi:MAG TPA: VanZ family protein [Ferruginibacter sp.]|nr:VanZ family protein [Ferruginibacter sp.]
MPVSINTSNTVLRAFLWLMLLVYLAVLAKLILFKQSPGFIKRHFLHHYSWQQAKNNMHKANLKPFTTIKLYMNTRGNPEYASHNLWGNTLGFIPMGFILPFLFVRLRTAFNTTLAVFIFSLAFEGFQLFSMLGIFDIDDLILNTLGGLIGYLLFWLLSKLIRLENSKTHFVPI